MKLKESEARSVQLVLRSTASPLDVTKSDIQSSSQQHRCVVVSNNVIDKSNNDLIKDSLAAINSLTSTQQIGS